MKQLCYLAPGTAAHRFDALFNELDIVATDHDILQLSSLVQFISREKTLYQMGYILCDLTGTDYSQEHILSAVQLLRRFSVARLIFIAPAGADTDVLYGHLAAFRVEDLIAVESATDLQAELRACLTGEEGGNYKRRLAALQTGIVATAQQSVSPLTIPAGLVIRVALAGSMPRIGVTTQAFALYHYLKGLGFRPAILDEAGAATRLLLEVCPEESEQCRDFVAVHGIPFCSRMLPQFDAYLCDLGTLTEDCLPQFCGADLSVLVGGVKPWELPALAAALKLLLPAGPRQLATLVSCATDQALQEVSKHLGDHYAAAPYHPDIWEAGSSAAYRAALLPCLKDLCGDKR